MPPRRKPPLAEPAFPELSSSQADLLRAKTSDSLNEFLDNKITLEEIRACNPNLHHVPLKSRNTDLPVQAPPEEIKRTSSTSLSRMRSSKRLSYFQKRPTTPEQSVQKFWKYHIFRIGQSQLYMSTNPDVKHMYCRNGPGYFVNIETNPTQAVAFRLKFLYNDEREPIPSIRVTKYRDGAINVSVLGSISRLGDDFTFTKERTEVKLFLTKCSLPEVESLLKEDMSNTSLRQTVQSLTRYHVGSTGEPKRWTVGSEPRIKRKNTNKLRLSEDTYKLQQKKAVFFRGSGLLGLFRPCERRLKKKLIRTINSRNDHIRGVSLHMDSHGYYKSGDGFHVQDPGDDSPDDLKLGWLTIYDDEALVKEKCLWEIIMAVTFSVGFEKLV